MPEQGGPHETRDVTVTPPAVVRRAVTAAGIGNVTEWYDFGVYAYLEKTIETVFLPPGTPGGPVIVAGLFAASFLVRPFGGCSSARWPTASAGRRPCHDDGADGAGDVRHRHPPHLRDDR